MNFSQAIASGFKNYANFERRASRAEFWYWQLFAYGATMLSELVDLYFAAYHPLILDPYMPYIAYGSSHDLQFFGPMTWLALLIPSYAMQIRRLHDVNRSGWWILIGITFIGLFFPLLYWACKKGTAGLNRFGEEPLQGFGSTENPNATAFT